VKNKQFSIFQSPRGYDFEIIQRGWNWWAFLFPVIWLAYHKLWKEAVVLAVPSVFYSFLLPTLGTVDVVVVTILYMVFMFVLPPVVIAAVGHRLVERKLIARGWVGRGCIVAPSAYIAREMFEHEIRQSNTL
jgi:hypothetical protein